jgi:hypothetical protein
VIERVKIGCTAGVRGLLFIKDRVEDEETFPRAESLMLIDSIRSSQPGVGVENHLFDCAGSGVRAFSLSISEELATDEAGD